MSDESVSVLPRHKTQTLMINSLRVAQKLLRTQEPWKCCFDVREIVRLCEWCFNVKSALPKSCDIVLMGDEGARRLFPHILPGTLQSFHHFLPHSIILGSQSDLESFIYHLFWQNCTYSLAHAHTQTHT